MQNLLEKPSLKTPSKAEGKFVSTWRKLAWIPSSGVFLILLVSLVMPMKGDGRRVLLTTQTQPDPASLFEFGQTYQREIGTGEYQVYLLQLFRNQYLRLSFDQKGVDLKVALYCPDGRMAVEVENREGGTGVVSLIAENDGLHRLEMRSLEKAQTSGTYQLRVEEVRSADASDRQRIDGERALAAGERLRSQSDVYANREAIKSYENAYLQLNATEGKQGAARALKSAGEIYYLLSQPRQALAHYQQALSILSATPSPLFEAELRTDLVYVYIHLGDYAQALTHATVARKLSESVDDARRRAQALICLSEVFYAFGDRWKALEYTKEAVPLLESIGDRRWRATSMLSLGYLYTDIGKTKEAAQCLDQALAIYTAVSDKRGKALAQSAIATLKANLGESQQALNLYSESLSVFQAAGDRFWEASVIQNIGSVYQDLGHNDKALDHFNKALPIWREIESPANEAGTLSIIGWMYYLANNNQQALKYFQQVLSISKALSDKKYQANALRKIGAVYYSLGDEKQALSHYRQALSLHRADGEHLGESSTLSEIGRLYLNLRRNRQARSSFKQALALNRARGDRFAEAETLYQLARVETSTGSLVKASTDIQAALDIVEELRANVISHRLRVTYFASIQRYFEFFLSLMMQQNVRHPAGGFDAQALAISERARARSLLELLSEASANIRQGADPKLLEQARALQMQISDLAERRVKLKDAGAPATELGTIAQELEALIAQRDRVETWIKAKNPRYASLAQPQPMSASEIQAMLDEDTLLLEFALGAESSYVWVVTRTTLKEYKLPGRAEIEKAASELQDVLAPPDSAPVLTDKLRGIECRKKAESLSQLILKPIANQFGHKRLVIVADGILQYIPFSILPKPSVDRSTDRKGYNGKTAMDAQPIPLIQNHEIVNLPSASTLAVLRRETAGRKKAPKAVAVLADPVFEAGDWRLRSLNGPQVPSMIGGGGLFAQLSDQSLKRSGILKRLRGTLREAKTIEGLTAPADRFIAVGFDANLTRATSPELSQFRVIHFATHGLLDRDNPELSSLVFSLFDKQGKQQEGYLRLQDIYNLNLPAELVVLSACDTGLGKEFKGEGLVGLTRGFMYAGAPRVMASLWKVDDEPTAKLMRYFYEHLLKEKMSPAAALRAAQLTLSQDAEWSAPYHWGSFVLQGEWK